MNGTVLITGGAKRIGAAIAAAMAKEGWNIALHYRSSAKQALNLAEQIRSTGARCELFQADFSRMEAVKALIPSVYNEMPDLKVLINSVSLFGRAKMMDTTESVYDNHFQINLKTPFFLSQAFAGSCDDGHIINLLDTKISKNAIQYFTYSLTKKALMAFTEMAAFELGPMIRVNAVAPGLILPSAGTEPEAFERMGKRIPVQTTGDPDDIASAVLFLVKSRFITGECIFVDGGEKLL